MYDYVGLGGVVLLLVAFAFLAYRSWRARRLWVKLAGGIPSTLLALFLLLVLGGALKGYSMVNATYANPVVETQVVASADLLPRGERYAQTCAGCHAVNGNLPLTGADFGTENGLPLGTFWAPNLTPSHFEDWSDGEIIRAIREGIGKDGRSLIIMPSHLFRSMSDEDAQALVAYLRSQPEDLPDTPEKKINLIGALMIGGLMGDAVFSHQQPISEPQSAPPAGPTAEYGQYLKTVAGCVECHGSDLNGVQIASPVVPAGPSLRAFVTRYSAEEFIQTIRSGQRPDGTTLAETMPWSDYKLFSDDDLRAIYLYTKSFAP